MTLREALTLSQQRSLDLVEISPTARPPVCKIVDYGKYRYREEKQSREAKKHAVVSKVKELKFHVNIAAHDYATKVSHAEDFLKDGDKVKILMVFRGREITHSNIGMEIMKRIKSELLPVCQVEAEPKVMGKNITMMLGPLPANKRAALKRAEDKAREDSGPLVDPAVEVLENKVLIKKGDDPKQQQPPNEFNNNPFANVKK